MPVQDLLLCAFDDLVKQSVDDRFLLTDVYTKLRNFYGPITDEFAAARGKYDPAAYREFGAFTDEATRDLHRVFFDQFREDRSGMYKDAATTYVLAGSVSMLVNGPVVGARGLFNSFNDGPCFAASRAEDYAGRYIQGVWRLPALATEKIKSAADLHNFAVYGVQAICAQPLRWMTAIGHCDNARGRLEIFVEGNAVNGTPMSSLAAKTTQSLNSTSNDVRHVPVKYTFDRILWPT